MMVNSTYRNNQHWINDSYEGANAEGGALCCEVKCHTILVTVCSETEKEQMTVFSPFGRRNRQKGAGPIVPSIATINTLEQFNFLCN